MSTARYGSRIAWVQALCAVVIRTVVDVASSRLLKVVVVRKLKVGQLNGITL